METAFMNVIPQLASNYRFTFALTCAALLAACAPDHPTAP